MDWVDVIHSARVFICSQKKPKTNFGRLIMGRIFLLFLAFIIARFFSIPTTGTCIFSSVHTRTYFSPSIAAHLSSHYGIRNSIDRCLLKN